MIVVDGKDLAWQEGMTIADLLDTIEDVSFCSVVRMNGRLISSPDFDHTTIPDEAEINLLPLVAGG